MDPSANGMDNSGALDSAVAGSSGCGGGDHQDGLRAGGGSEDPGAGADPELMRLKAKNALFRDLVNSCTAILGLLDVGEQALQIARANVGENADVSAKMHHYGVVRDKLGVIHQQVEHVQDGLVKIRVDHMVPALGGNQSREQQPTENNEQQAPTAVNLDITVLENTAETITAECNRGAQCGHPLDVFHSTLLQTSLDEINDYLDAKHSADTKLTEALDAALRVFDPLERHLNSLDQGQEAMDEDNNDVEMQ